MKPPGSARWLAAAVLGVAALAGCRQVAEYFLLPKEGIRDAEYDVVRQQGVAFKTSDGVALEPRSALQTVFHSASAPSRVILPVVPR